MIQLKSVIRTHSAYLLIIALLLSTACKKEKDVVYEVNEQEVVPPSAQKGKLKTEGQYLSILHANLFQQALSAKDQVELTNIIHSMGDKELAHKLIISNFMNSGEVVMPTEKEMRANIDSFIVETYKRFYVREPSEAEKEYFKNYIESHPNITPEEVYFSFALSDEYYFY